MFPSVAGLLKTLCYSVSSVVNSTMQRYNLRNAKSSIWGDAFVRFLSVKAIFQNLLAMCVNREGDAIREAAGATVTESQLCVGREVERI